MTIPFHSAFFDYFTQRFEFVYSIKFHICKFVLPIYVEDFLDYPTLKVLISFTSSLVKVHNSELYRKTLSMQTFRFLIFVSLMLSCFPEYLSVCCKLLLLKLFFSLCLHLYLIGYPDIYIFSNLFVNFF